MAGPKPRSYNAHTFKKVPDNYVRPSTLTTSGITKLALEELKDVKNLDEFREICRQQKEKRGW